MLTTLLLVLSTDNLDSSVATLFNVGIDNLGGRGHQTAILLQKPSPQVNG
jgi:hypothetical protein